MAEHTITQTGENNGLLAALRDCDRATPREVATNTTVTESTTETYVVEYGDERGNVNRADFGPSELDEAISLALGMVRAMGVDPDDAYIPTNAYAGSIETNLYTYVAAGAPWPSIYDQGDADNGWTVYGCSEEFGNWSVSVTVVWEA